MTWFWVLLAGVFLSWAAIFSFNLWSTAKLRKHYGYTWRQVKTHVCLRGALSKRGQWHLALAPHLLRFIKALDHLQLLEAGSGLEDDLWMRRFGAFLELEKTGHD